MLTTGQDIEIVGGEGNFFATDTGGSFVVLGTIQVSAGGLIQSNGDLTLAGTSRYQSELGGVSSSQYGRLFVSGQASLAGTLEIVFDEGYAPQAGDSFEVLTFDSLVGDFATFTAPAGANLTKTTASDSVLVSAPETAAAAFAVFDEPGGFDASQKRAGSFDSAVAQHFRTASGPG